MSSPKNFQTQQNFTPYRLANPKTSPTQLSSNQISQYNAYIFTQQKGKNNSHSDGDHLSSIHYQNNLLRQQNKALKREINLIKGQEPTKSSSTLPICNTLQINDLRETIKKQAGEIKELKTKLEVISKQCKMYQEIIDKMQGKINKLTQQNKNLQIKIKQFKQIQSSQKQSKNDIKNQDLISKTSKQRFNKLSQRISQLTSMYMNLEEKVQENDKQWQLWKQKWFKQKYYYLNRIHDLQKIAGIGIESKQFYKKKF